MKFSLGLKKGHAKHVSLQKVDVGERAMHDWMLSLCIFVGIIVIAVLFAGYLFTRVSSGDFFVDTSLIQPNSASYTRKTLIEANTFFEARKKDYEAYLTSSTVEIDPSI